MKKSGPEFESLISELLRQIKKNTPLESYDVKFGSKNRIIGTSEYRHQIDISLHGQDVIYIIEAKNWNKKVGVETILILGSRLTDIRSALAPTQVYASVISTQKETRSATALAKYFGINIDVVKNLDEYAVSFVNRHFTGNKERLCVSDDLTGPILRICTRCGKRFAVQENEKVCEACKPGRVRTAHIFG